MTKLEGSGGGSDHETLRKAPDEKATEQYVSLGGGLLPEVTNFPMQIRLHGYLERLKAQHRIPCAEMIVTHKDRIVSTYKNVEDINQAAKGELIYRQYSMTKTVVTCAAMVLFERGEYQFNQPVWTFLGDQWRKENMRVIDLAKSAEKKSLVTVPCLSDITLGQLMTHTSGLSHGLLRKGQGNPIDDIYADAGISCDDCILLPPDRSGLPDLQTFCDKLAKCPLLFQPGEHWQYSYGMELMGRIIELVSGAKDLNEFVQQTVCKRLGMVDTTFHLSEEQKTRLCPYFLFNPVTASLEAKPTHFPVYCSGSAGLFSSASDYHKLCRTLLRGGIGDNGQRILSSKTVEWMMGNRLRKGPSAMTVQELSLFPSSVAPGYGFGFGASVWTDSGLEHQINSVGEYSWAGATTTYFWIDPEEEVTVVFMTSVFEPDKQNFALYSTLHSLVYGGLNDTKRHPQG